MKNRSQKTSCSPAETLEDMHDGFGEELNHQCRYIVLPVIIVALFAWLPFIPLDKQLYPQFGMFVYLRYGLSVVGGLGLLWYFSPFYKDKHYWLVFWVMLYLETASGVIVGATAGNGVYMGGLAIIFMGLPLLPFRKGHAYILLVAPVFLFLSLGLLGRMTFDTMVERYSLYNLLAAGLVCGLGIYVLDNVRRRNYIKKNVIQATNEELQKTTSQLERTNEELRKANQIKSELLGLAAHDLKNPLQVIICYTDLLKVKMEEDPAAFEKLNRIHKSSDKMLQLISGLLETSAIDSGQLRLNLTCVDVGKLAEGVVEHLEDLAEKKKQKIKFNTEDDCIIKGDKMLLQEVMDNLVSNAIKFSPYGKYIWVSVKSNYSDIIFSVRDEGPGLTSDDKVKLFQKFQRLSARPTGGETTTGLGLAIIKDLVELHHGRVQVESQPGSGSVFQVTLPRQIEETVVSSQ